MQIRIGLVAAALLVASLALGQAYAQPRGGFTMPQGDPNAPVVERGGFGPTPAEIVRFRDGIYLIRSVGSRNITAFISTGRAPMEITSAVQMEFGNMAFVVLPNVQAVLDELK
jgi:hypothetical protein